MATSVNGSGSTVSAIIGRAQALFDDLSFTTAREWKAASPDRKVVGYMPIYVPRELIHAADMLPLGIVGGGDQLEVIHGDAYYQSYICRIPRSTIELGVSGRSITGAEAAAIGIAHEAVADPERAALAYFEEHLKPKSASSLRYAVKAARLDYVARVKDKIRAVERLYLDELMATHDAVAGLEAFIAKRSPQWQHR